MATNTRAPLPNQVAYCVPRPNQFPLWLLFLLFFLVSVLVVVLVCFPTELSVKNPSFAPVLLFPGRFDSLSFYTATLMNPLLIFFLSSFFSAVSGNDTLGGDASVHSTYVQYVDGSPDSALYAATNGQMYFHPTNPAWL